MVILFCSYGTNVGGLTPPPPPPNPGGLDGRFIGGVGLKPPGGRPIMGGGGGANPGAMPPKKRGGGASHKAGEPKLLSQ